MPADREDESTRRSVVPEAAGRSLWLAAAWTGVGAAVVCATLAIVVVAICWLPAAGGSGASGHSVSAIKAGVLSFLAALHGGVTVDGMTSWFVPLGLTVVVGLAAWRAGSGLADAAESLAERDPLRLALAGAVQSVSFMSACLVGVPFATLGTSDVPFLGVGVAALLLFSVTGGLAFVRSSALAGWLSTRVPAYLAAVPRAAAVVVAVYLGVGALVVGAAVLVHHSQVEALSQQVGGGWGGVPVLLLGVLAAPNAVIAGSSYLAGPGFAVGSDSAVSAAHTTHGGLPAFPLLGAMPQGPGATTVVWGVLVTTALLAGAALARAAGRSPGWWPRQREVLLGAAGAGLLMAVLAWQGGGAIGDGRLRAVGASPWRVGLAVSAQVLVVASVVTGAVAAWHRLRPKSGSVVVVSRPQHSPIPEELAG